MKQKAFTLIELLVVISIISFLASVVIASTNTAKNNARIKGGMYFVSQLTHRYNIIGSWNFEDGTAKDSSGNGSDGDFINWLGNPSINQPSYNKGKSIKFNKSFVNIDTEIKTYTNFDWTKSFAASVWVKTNQKTGRFYLFSKRLLYIISLNEGKMEMIYSMSHSIAGTTNIADNKWHNLSFIVDRENKTIILYVDGQIEKIDHIIDPDNGSVISWNRPNDYVKIIQAPTGTTQNRYGGSDNLGIAADPSSGALSFPDYLDDITLFVAN